MITYFKIFENSQILKTILSFDDIGEDYYYLNLDELWNVYYDNFKHIYPDVTVKTRDKNFIHYYYRDDINKILIGKEAQLKYFHNKEYFVEGIISDVWTRYSINALVSKWQYKFKIDDKWNIVKNNNIKLRKNSEKNDLEEELLLLLSAKNYNI
jgi:hypothetical protein